MARSDQRDIGPCSAVFGADHPVGRIPASQAVKQRRRARLDAVSAGTTPDRSKAAPGRAALESKRRGLRG